MGPAGAPPGPTGRDRSRRPGGRPTPARGNLQVMPESAPRWRGARREGHPGPGRQSRPAGRAVSGAGPPSGGG